MTDETDRRAALQVISGEATPEEIAAVLALVSARGAAWPADRRVREQPSLWAAPHAAHRRSFGAGDPHPNAWRTSYWPR